MGREIAEAMRQHDARRGRVLSLVQQIHDRCRQVGAATLARRVEEELVRKLEDDRFHLVVVGEFNRGKTSLVNGLLGRSALPAGVTPTTALIHHIRFAEEATARLVLADGSRREVPFAEIDGYTADGELAEDEAIRYLEVGYPAELLRDRVVLVDTPGVNDLNLQRAEVTYKYIPQSDAVLFVLDAGQPLTESERIFLQEKLIGQSRDKIVFVVNKADLWSDEERDEALGYLRDELARVIDGPVLFPISAQRALSGAPESGVDALVSHLQLFLAEQRGRLMLDNALGEALGVMRSLRHGLDARRRTARMGKDEIDRRIARIELDLEGQKRTVEQRRAAMREEVAAIRAWASRDVERFAEDAARQLEAIIDRAPIDDLRQHLGSFVEATFASWAEAEANEVARALEDVAEKTVALMREDARDASRRLSDGLADELAAPGVGIDTFGYDLGVAALFSVGVGMVFSNLLIGATMTAAAPALAYLLRGRIEAETRARTKEQTSLAVRTAAASVTPRLEAMIDEFAERLGQWLEAAGSEVHRELLDVLRDARRREGELDSEGDRVERECDRLEDQLGELTAATEAERVTLWTGP